MLGAAQPRTPANRDVLLGFWNSRPENTLLRIDIDPGVYDFD